MTMAIETKTIGYVGRNEVAIERYVSCADGKPYTFDGSNYDYETEDRNRR